MKNVQVVLNAQTEQRVKEAMAYTRGNPTFEEMVALLVEKAARDVVYRHNNNARNWAVNKQVRERMKELERKAADLGVSIDELLEA